jgi:hypothetical protein
MFSHFVLVCQLLDVSYGLQLYQAVLKTNCEIVWAEINITGTKKICVASYYRPPSDDGTALDQLNISLRESSQ